MTNASVYRTSAWIVVAACAVARPVLAADDWPTWGHDPSRNMVSGDKGLPSAIEPGKPKDDGTIDAEGLSKNIKWIAKLGNQTYGNPTVSGGKIFLGTNNGWKFNADRTGDFGVGLCLDQKTGKQLWALFSPKLAAGKNSDWEQIGLCCSPTVDGQRVYVVTNRCEVLCLDIDGMTSQNKGPFTDEAQYIAGPGSPPSKVGPGDADIIWRYDMRDELGVFPHNMTSSAVLAVGDKLFVTTSNAVDWTDKHIPSPDSPALICLDKNTGKLLGQERSGICQRMYLSNWSSPAYGIVGGKPMVVFGGGDGWCYGFDPQPDSKGTLPELWRCDCNPPERRMKNGKPLKHSETNGPSEIISTPVVVKDRVYVAIGHDPESGDGPGAFTCIDATKRGDISANGKIWVNDKIGRSLSTASISDGLVYIADFAGIVWCLELETGKTLWSHDTESHIWGSTLVGDGKVYVGNETGTLTILAAGKEKKPIAAIDFKGPIYATPVTADGIMYIATESNLYAIQGDAK